MIRDSLATALRAALVDVGIEPPAEIHLERPGRREHGDWSSNVAMATAKAAGRVPRELARRARRPARGGTARPRRAGGDRRPGLRQLPPRARRWLHDVLTDVLAAGRGGLRAARPRRRHAGQRRVRVGQPDGPAPRRRRPLGGLRRLAVPHPRAHAATWSHREYYLNDRGVQMDLFGASLAARARRRPSCPRTATPATTSREWAAEMPADVDPKTWGYDTVQAATSAESLGAHRRHLRHLVQREQPGRSPAPSTPRSQDLRDHGVVFDEDGAVWLRTTDFGDDKDRVAREVRRRAHLPAPRHRLPPRQVRPRPRAAHRRLGRRPPRLRGAAARPACRRSATTPDELEIILGQLVSLVRGGEAGAALEARRRPRRCSTTSSTRSVPTSRGSPSSSSRSTPARPSTST